MAFLTEVLDPNCEDDGATLLDNLHSFLKPSTAMFPIHCWHRWSTGRCAHSRLYWWCENVIGSICQWFNCQASAS